MLFPLPNRLPSPKERGIINPAIRYVALDFRGLQDLGNLRIKYIVHVKQILLPG